MTVIGRVVMISVPLVVVSADRPHELRGTGANQTTRQPGVLGAATRFDADTGLEPVGDHRWRAEVSERWFVARGPNGGLFAAQATREQRLAIATHVIDNTGTLADLRARVDAIHAELTAS